ncbi:hypothetical protein C8J57DRAFT_1452186 [Mycena rebaudengoi]|nr:hypothetical protein C8J57DRAFT_1452186 [Mycena rebaudengoi]
MGYPPIPLTSPLTYSVAPPLAHDDPLPSTLTSPIPPSRNSKSIFAFWHSGMATLPPEPPAERSPLNVSHYIDTSSPAVVPAAFTGGSLEGTYKPQHISDLIRFPLLLKYGGLYLDVGVLQFGDIDQLWTDVISNPASPYDFAGFTLGDAPFLKITNFAMMCGADNPLIWEGKTITTGMHAHALVSHVPFVRVPTKDNVDSGSEDQDGLDFQADDAAMTDYVIQIQALSAAQHWLDEQDGWDGPKYVREKMWLVNALDGALTIEEMTGWSGQRQLKLFSLQIPKHGEKETADQAVGESWCLKLWHGYLAKILGADSLGMLWRKYEGSDNGEGTYAGWLRWAEVNCRQDCPIQRMEVPVYEATRKASLIDYL